MFVLLDKIPLLHEFLHQIAFLLAHIIKLNIYNLIEKFLTSLRTRIEKCTSRFNCHRSDGTVGYLCA